MKSQEITEITDVSGGQDIVSKNINVGVMSEAL